MKKHTLSAAIALAAVSATGAFASEGSDLAPIYLDRTAISVDAAYMMDIDNLSVDSLWGGTIGMSYIFNRSEKSAHSIGLTFGYFTGDESAHTDSGVVLGEPQVNPGVVLIDGYKHTLDEKVEQEILPIIVSYKYHRNITDSISAYIGARGGVYISKTKATRESVYVNMLFGATPANPDPVPLSLDSYFSEGDANHTSICPTLGLELGVEYKFSKKWSWYISGSIDASFNMTREKDAADHEGGGIVAGSSPESTEETAISTTIRSGFTYQF